jgi:hypothetical protein
LETGSQWSSYLHFSLSLGWQVLTTTLSFFLLRWGIFCQDWPGTMIFPISASSVAWDMSSKHPAVSWDGVLLTFCLG